MTDGQRIHAPTADDIEARFHSLSVRTLRPAVLGMMRASRTALRMDWNGVDIAQIEGLEQPFILAANHMSHADTAAILSVLPRRIRARTAVAAALDVFGDAIDGPKQPIKRELLQLVTAAGFRAFAFDRHGPPLRSVRTSTELINRGWNLLLYPEGTRSRDGSIRPFKPGVGLLAKLTGRPVIPVCVSGGLETLPCGAVWPRRGQSMSVRFGAPIRFEKGDNPQELTEQIHDAIVAMMPRRTGVRTTAPDAHELPAGAGHEPARAMPY